MTLPMGRLLGVDLGTKRVGVAICDASQVLATPHCVIERPQRIEQLARQLGRIIRDEDAVGVVVGIPNDLSGERGIAARAMEKDIETLRVALDVPLAVLDERLTTAMAHSLMQLGGKSARKRRSTIDAAAATTLLQGWLDAIRTELSPREENDESEGFGDDVRR